MPFQDKALRDRLAGEYRRANAPCALQLTAACRQALGAIDYAADWRSGRALQVDHIDPAGGDSRENSQPSCRDCNRRKSNGRGRADVVFVTARSNL